MTFDEWRQSADAIMLSDYCIDTRDAGVDDHFLERCWRDGDSPKEFVEWFAEKYDFIPRIEWEWGYRRRRG